MWHKIIKTFSKDFYVLVYDHYGRGYSDAPEADYDHTFYINELALLMQHIGWNKAYIVGLSMGGPIAVEFAVTYPKLVDDKLTLIAPAGLLHGSDFPLRGKILAAPFTQWLLTFQFMRNLMIGKDAAANTKAMGYDALAQQDDGSKEIAELMTLQQLVLPYHLGALGSTIRMGPLRGQGEYFEALGKRDVKVTVIWGSADDTCPYALATEVLKRVPTAKLVTVPGGGHDLAISHPDIVAEEIKGCFW